MEILGDNNASPVAPLISWKCNYESGRVKLVCDAGKKSGRDGASLEARQERREKDGRKGEREREIASLC